MSEKTRKVLRLSIVFFFVLAVFFFCLIFLLALAKKHVVQNGVDQNVTIQQGEYNTWGKIPGTLDFTWSRKYRPYQFQNG